MMDRRSACAMQRVNIVRKLTMVAAAEAATTERVDDE
jgi:hypothetical protein